MTNKKSSSVIFVISLLAAIFFIYIIFFSIEEKEKEKIADEIKLQIKIDSYLKNGITYSFETGEYEKVQLRQLKRLQERNMERAFDIIENETGINFIKVESDGKIKVYFPEENYGNNGSSEDVYTLGEAQSLSSEDLNIKGNIWIYLSEAGFGACDYPSVQIHEVLHLFGYDHIKNESSIMYKYKSCNVRSIDKEIIEELKQRIID